MVGPCAEAVPVATKKQISVAQDRGKEREIVGERFVNGFRNSLSTPGSTFCGDADTRRETPHPRRALPVTLC